MARSSRNRKASTQHDQGRQVKGSERRFPNVAKKGSLRADVVLPTLTSNVNTRNFNPPRGGFFFTGPAGHHHPPTHTGTTTLALLKKKPADRARAKLDGLRVRRTALVAQLRD